MISLIHSQFVTISSLSMTYSLAYLFSNTLLVEFWTRTQSLPRKELLAEEAKKQCKGTVISFCDMGCFAR